MILDGDILSQIVFRWNGRFGYGGNKTAEMLGSWDVLCGDAAPYHLSWICM